MKRFFYLSLFLMSVSLSSAQYWAGNTGHELIPGQNDISNSVVAAGPFAGWNGFMSGGQIQNGATNNFVIEFLSGTTDQGGPQGRRGPVNVWCDVEPIGSVTFDYGGVFGYVHTDAGDNQMAGMMMRGGISLDSGFKMNAGASFRWVQMYKETTFDGTVGGWVIDSPAPATSPLYTNYIAPNPNNVGTMAAALVDVPFDSNGQQFMAVDFVSYLACTHAGDKELDLLGSFKWGFTHNGDLANGSTDIKSDYLINYFDGGYYEYDAFKTTLGAMSPGWTTAEGCFDCVVAVPEPALLAAVLPTFLVLLRRRRDRQV